MKYLMMVLVLLVAGCATQPSMYVPRENPSRIGRIERVDAKPAYRSEGWIKQNCADCGGNGPKYQGQERPSKR